MTRLSLRPEPGIVLSGRWYEPERPKGTALLYVSGVGIEADPERPALEEMARKGRPVFAVDVRGLGATQSHWTHGNEWDAAFGPGYKSVMLALMLGRPYLAMRAEDILVCARWLKQHGAAEVVLVATGEAGPAALHAAALEQDLFATVRIKGSLCSWSDVAATMEPKDQFVNEVYGALRVYDLPELAASLPGRKLRVISPRNAAGARRW
jgi:hypothetical protein